MSYRLYPVFITGRAYRNTGIKHYHATSVPKRFFKIPVFSFYLACFFSGVITLKISQIVSYQKPFDVTLCCAKQYRDFNIILQHQQHIFCELYSFYGLE